MLRPALFGSVELSVPRIGLVGYERREIIGYKFAEDKSLCCKLHGDISSSGARITGRLTGAALFAASEWSA